MHPLTLGLLVFAVGAGLVLALRDGSGPTTVVGAALLGLAGLVLAWKLFLYGVRQIARAAKQGSKD